PSRLLTTRLVKPTEPWWVEHDAWITTLRHSLVGCTTGQEAFRATEALSGMVPDSGTRVPASHITMGISP
ncbi:MAG: hypothetical protein ACRDS0_38260, partial [Pseudonocardiaceae bacterium]